MRIFIIIICLLLSSLVGITQRLKRLGQPNLHYYLPFLQADTFKLTVDNAYDATSWNDNLELATKNAIRDKIESLGSGGVTTMAAIGSSPNANAATISGSTLTLQPASASFGGVVTTATQSFAGAKTFSSDITANSVLVGNGPGNFVSNTRLGADALINNSVSGDNGNTAVGHSALISNTTGYFNSGFGRNTLFSLSTGNSNTAAGHNAGYNATGSGNNFFGNAAGYDQTTGNNKYWNSNSATQNLEYGDYVEGQLLINPGSSPSLTASAQFEIKSTTRGFLTPVMTAVQRIAISSPANGLEVYDTDSSRKMIYNSSAWKGVAWTSDVGGGADGNGIYGGPGSLLGNVTVTGANNSLTFDDIFAFKINSDYNTYAKANGTGIYSEAIIGAGNIYEIGYTPVAGVFSKGAGVFIDTNENVGMGAQPPTTMPLYAIGASTFVQGLQSNHANFLRVDNLTTTGNIGLTSYFITIDATAGNVTLTLPAASAAFGNNMGITYKLQRIDASGNTVTIQRAGADTINGGTSFTITTQYTEIKQLQCTSTSTWAQH